ncbi:hypothetical protein AGABI2DRAFT_122926 [Agaricus bisporus var. bisporus H97]|uniref:hypothetical protein n=1 Tax=Agaricus bisporus var. bisporus (strain H97 / ATCC MYA-4626 / FGSC 10389) TaxID=936046 RepID=UPI00029F7C3F|nr:hypothetical protein AGABI2DRAFT_122926 [Agaricus bisporus var. bisporus H97]EKV42197.1 hypothetical protein AGABI2DRAFT_122926 [Agaricus bisporus var. bisporus H97]
MPPKKIVKKSVAISEPEISAPPEKKSKGKSSLTSKKISSAPPTAPTKKQTGKMTPVAVQEASLASLAKPIDGKAPEPAEGVRRSTRHTSQQEGNPVLSIAPTTTTALKTTAPTKTTTQLKANSALMTTKASKTSTAPKATSLPKATTQLKTTPAPKATKAPTTTMAPKTTASPKTTIQLKTNPAPKKTPASKTTKVSKASAVPKTAASSNGLSAKGTSTVPKESVTVHSEIPEQFLEEMAALKAKLAQSEATVDKYKKSTSVNAKVLEKKDIPEPKGKYNIQVAMGLEDNKDAYNDCRAAISEAMLDARIPIHLDWRHQDSVSVARVFSIAKEKEPRLAGFERNWAIAAIMRTINKNIRSYGRKRAKKRKEGKKDSAGTEDQLGGEEGTGDGRTGDESNEETNPEDEDDGKHADEASPSEADADEGVASEVDADEGVASEVDADEVVASEVDADEAVASEMDADEAVPSEADEAVPDVDMSGSGEEDNNMEEDGEGIDEEECRPGQRFLKRRLLPDDESDEEVNDNPRKKRNI